MSTVRKRRLPARARRAIQRTVEEQAAPTGGPAPTRERLGPQYAAGPQLHLAPEREQEGDSAAPKRERPAPAGPAAQPEPPTQTPGVPTTTPLPAAQGAGQPDRVVAYSRSLRLQGRTDATFDGGSFHTENVRVARGEGCAGCAAADCLRATGTLVASYSVATNVTLPSAATFPDLTACQRRRVQNAIDTVLAPHEQQHVQAFRTYNGTTRRPFDLTLCRADFDGRIQAMFEAEASARRAAAQAASDALDPFHFDVDLDCEDAPPPRRQATAAASAEEE